MSFQIIYNHWFKQCKRKSMDEIFWFLWMQRKFMVVTWSEVKESLCLTGRFLCESSWGCLWNVRIFFLKFVLILNYAFPDLLNTTSTTFIVDAIVEMQERDAISSYRNRNFLSFQLRSLFITLSPIHFSPHESLIILELDVVKLWIRDRT